MIRVDISVVIKGMGISFSVIKPITKELFLFKYDNNKTNILK